MKYENENELPVVIKCAPNQDTSKVNLKILFNLTLCCTYDWTVCTMLYFFAFCLNLFL